MDNDDEFEECVLASSISLGPVRHRSDPHAAYAPKITPLACHHAFHGPWTLLITAYLPVCCPAEACAWVPCRVQTCRAAVPCMMSCSESPRTCTCEAAETTERAGHEHAQGWHACEVHAYSPAGPADSSALVQVLDPLPPMHAPAAAPHAWGADPAVLSPGALLPCKKRAATEGLALNPHPLVLPPLTPLAGSRRMNGALPRKT